jgi:hypothetical protein
MAQDADRFTSMRLWEILIAPSIIERKFWSALSRMDLSAGGYGRRMVAAVDSRIFRSLKDIHKMSLFDYDEDELVLAPIISSVYMFFPFPFREQLWWTVRFDEQAPHEKKERTMEFYKACVRRHLYFHGPEKQFLSKNPAFSSKVDALRHHFPDARVVCNMRTPYDTVPSLISALYVAWELFDNDRQGDVFRDHVLELAAHWYRHPVASSKRWPANRFVFVTFDELRNDLKSTVAGLYEQLEIEMTPAFVEMLEIERDRARTYSSRHRYSLERYGLTPQNVLEDFGDIFGRFGFETEHPDGTNAPNLDARH